jgi:hypothetical protein
MIYVQENEITQKIKIITVLKGAPARSREITERF